MGLISVVGATGGSAVARDQHLGFRRGRRIRIYGLGFQALQ